MKEHSTWKTIKLSPTRHGFTRPPSENAAIARCMRAFQRAYQKKLANLDEGEDKYFAEKADRLAYLRAVPPLSGYDDIRDFITCIAFADLAQILPQNDAEHHLNSARIAVAVVRHEPGTQPKRLGRPPKNPPTEENK
jgi:hypothetical protein